MALDIGGNSRIVGSPVDIGAFEFQWPVGIDDPHGPTRARASGVYVIRAQAAGFSAVSTVVLAT